MSTSMRLTMESFIRIHGPRLFSEITPHGPAACTIPSARNRSLCAFALFAPPPTSAFKPSSSPRRDLISSSSCCFRSLTSAASRTRFLQRFGRTESRRAGWGRLGRPRLNTFADHTRTRRGGGDQCGTTSHLSPKDRMTTFGKNQTGKVAEKCPRLGTSSGAHHPMIKSEFQGQRKITCFFLLRLPFSEQHMNQLIIYPKNEGPQTHRVLRAQTPAMQSPTPAMESPKIVRVYYTYYIYERKPKWAIPGTPRPFPPRAARSRPRPAPALWDARRREAERPGARSARPADERRRIGEGGSGETT